jgi:septal ring factor EnvC (AmiA/AmiB activator)
MHDATIIHRLKVKRDFWNWCDRIIIMKIVAPISIGELCDKISILEIKRKKILNTEKLEHIHSELLLLSEILAQQEEVSHSLRHELKEVNKKLWQIEDDIRECEREKDFSEKFIALARSVCRYNDKRFAIKNEINKRYNSTIVEEKLYERY